MKLCSSLPGVAQGTHRGQAMAAEGSLRGHTRNRHRGLPRSAESDFRLRKERRYERLPKNEALRPGRHKAAEAKMRHLRDAFLGFARNECSSSFQKTKRY